MSNELNQRNKQIVWDYWQKLNHVGVDLMERLRQQSELRKSGAPGFW